MNKMTNETIRTIVPAFILGGVGAIGIVILPIMTYNKGVQEANKNFIKSSTARYSDLNSDGLADIVVEQNSGDKIIYYNTGSEYLTAEQMKQREIQRIEQSYQEQLKKTNEFYKKAYDGNNVGGRE